MVPDLRSSGLALLDARIVEIEAGLMVDQEAQLVDAPMHAADIDPALDAQNSLIGERARELGRDASGIFAQIAEEARDHHHAGKTRIAIYLQLHKIYNANQLTHR